jgi:tRNA splicing endonuclease
MDLVKQDLESKGWIVKDGSLYGSDFILYKNTEGHSHGQYLVKYYEALPTYREVLGSIRCSTSVKKVTKK